MLIIGLLIAHELWIMPVGKGYGLKFGHFVEKARIPAMKYVQLGIVEHQGREDTITKKEILQVLKKGDFQRIMVVYSSGIWTKTPAGTKHLPKSRVKHAVRSWKEMKYAKLDRSFKARPMTDYLEITMLKSRELFLITLKKKPLSGARIYVDDKFMGLTDKEGRIKLNLGKGSHLITVKYKEKVKDKDIDFILHTSTLYIP